MGKKSTGTSQSAVPAPPVVAAKKRTARPAEHSLAQKFSKPAEITPEPTSEQIAKLAYSFWEGRGYQGGSAEEDWFRAQRELVGQSE